MLSLILPILAIVIPLGAYAFYGGGKGRVWGLVPGEPAQKEGHAGGVYRAAGTMLWKRGAAPFVVRAAALSSFFLGQMIVPGALLGLVGTAVMFYALKEVKSFPPLIVVQLSAPTGLVVAAHLLSAGKAMLDRSAFAVVKARRAWRWAIGHNVALLTVLGVTLVAWGQDAWQESSVAFTMLITLYAVISIAQALLVRHAAGAIEAYTALQAEHPAPASIEAVEPAV